MSYKYSKYNHHGILEDGTILIYNLFSSSVALLSLREFEILNQKNLVSSKHNDLIEVASKQGFLVPLEEDEIGKVWALRNINNFNSKRASFQILPTTHCNARCFYCYENNFEKSTMDSLTVEATIKFLKKFSLNMEEISIAWFGGEPLICEGIISKISKNLIPFLDKKNIGYTSNMITNGALISESNIKSFFKDYKIHDIQITLDGQGEEYINRKSFLDKTITYEQILNNIALLTQHEINVMVRINVDKDNLYNCLKVIKDLSNIDANNDYLWPYIAPLYSYNSDASCFKKEELNYVYKKAYRVLIDSNFIQTINSLPMSFMNATCFSTMINNYVISPKGDILKCEHLLDDSKEIVGTVFEGIKFNEAMAEWSNPTIPTDCVDCKYLPICQAGCKAAENLGFGFGRCSHVAFIDDAIIFAASYLLKKQGII